MALSERAFLAKYLTGAADYHDARNSTVEVADDTLRHLRQLGCEMEPPISARFPGRMYVATARRYAKQLRDRDAKGAA